MRKGGGLLQGVFYLLLESALLLLRERRSSTIDIVQYLLFLEDLHNRQHRLPQNCRGVSFYHLRGKERFGAQVISPLAGGATFVVIFALRFQTQMFES